MGSVIKKGVILVLSIWALISCESPVQAGLGNRVDINPPTLSVLSPKAGLFLHDLATFRVRASDDITVESVYVRAAMEAEFKANPPEWISIAPVQEEPGIWSWQKTTRNEEDGIFMVQFRAVDNSGKRAETENLVYTIKNLPPRIDLNIPNFSLKDRTQLQSEDINLARNGFSIDSGGVLIGYATDIQGLAFKSPKIKFWREGEAKPANWSEVDLPNWDLNGDGKVDQTDETSPQAVSKGREFRYYMTDHTERDANNQPVDPRFATPLPVGDYRFQLWVSDTGVNEEGQPSPISTVFPPVHTIDGVEYDSILIHVTPSYETPKLELSFSPNNTYQNESFLVQARAYHSAGIESVDLKVRKAGEMAQHSLAWESNTENLSDLDANGANTKSRTLESFFVIPGGYYPETGGGTFLFDSGTYEFEIQANSRAGATVRARQTIYIDNTPPSVQITQVDPGARIQTANWSASAYAGKGVFRQDAVHNIPEAYIVNGKVTINVSAKDSNGLGSRADVAGTKEIRSLRYLLVQANFADPNNPTAAELEGILPRGAGTWNASTNGLNPDLVYDAQYSAWTPRGIGSWKSGFLDELPNTAGEHDVYSKTIDTITVDTRRIFGALKAGSSSAGELYLFIAAKDQAGNLASLTGSANGSTVIGYHLHVDQRDDKPYVVFTDIKDTVNTPAALQGAYDNIMESTVRIRGTLEDDDGILVDSNSVQFKLLRESEFLDNVNDATQEVTVPFNAELFKGRKGRSLSFNFSRQDLGAAYGGDKLPDGVYRLTVLVWDDPGVKDGVASLSNSLTEPAPPVTLKPVWFGVDGDSPVFEKVVPQNNEFAGDNFVMEVAVSDANGPLHLEVRTPQANGAAPLNLNEKLQYWDIDYLRWISDPANTGKWFNSDPNLGTDSVTKFNLGKYGKDRLDALVADPAVPGITGEASLTKVLTTMLKDIDSIKAPVSSVAGGKTTTTYKFHIKNIDNNTPPHLTVGLSAQDRFLKKTDRILAVKLDKEKPHIRINNADAEVRWFQGMGSINGTVWDPYTAAEGAMPETTQEEAMKAAAAAHGSVSLMYYKKVRWTGNPLTAPAAPPLPTAGSEAAAGWVSVKMEFPNEPKSSWSVIIGDPSNADPSLGMVEPEGIYTLYLYAVDQAGSRGPEAPLKFQSYGLDKSAPVIVKIDIGGTPPNPPVDPPHRAGFFTLSGTITDTFALASFSVMQSKDGGTPTAIPFVPSLLPGATTHAWSIDNLPRKADGSALNQTDLTNGAHDGIYTYTFTLEDRSGRRATGQRIVCLDTKNPKVEVTSPPSVDLATPLDGKRAFFTNGRLEFTGSAADDAPGTVSKIMYYDADDTVTVLPAPAAWKSGEAAGVSGTNVWRIVTDLPAATPEGNRRIWIVAEDRMGHRSSQLSYANSASGGGLVSANYFPYAYDKAPPQLTEISIGSGTKWVSSRFTLDGLVGDSNALKSLVITQTKNGDSANAYARTITLINDDAPADPNLKDLLATGYAGAYPKVGDTKWPKPGTNWSSTKKWEDVSATLVDQTEFPVDKDGNWVPDAVAGKSGSYRYIIVATDISGRTATLERNVVVDVTPPTVALSSVTRPDNAWYAGDVSIRGTASDTSPGAVDVVYYWIGKQSDGAPAHATTANLASLWRKAEGVDNWTVYNIATDSAGPSPLAEGDYHLYVLAVDRGGNISAPLEYKFRIDRTAPTVAEDGTPASAAQQKNFGLKLAITETHRLYKIDITQTFTPQGSSTANAPVTITKITGVEDKTGAAVSPYQLTGLPYKDSAGTPYSAVELGGGNYDGTYRYEIKVYDQSSKPGVPGINLPDHVGVFVKTVSIDTKAPLVTVNSPRGTPAQNAFISSNKLFLTGNAVDAHPGPVYYWDGPGEGAGSSPASVPDTLALAEAAVANQTSGWKKASGSPPAWTIDHTLSGTVQDGARHVMIIAFDTLGHRNANITYIAPDDKLIPTEKNDFYFPYAMDSSAPQLSEFTGNDLDRKAMSASFHLNGVVGDSNGVRSIIITQALVGDNDSKYNFDYPLFDIWDENAVPPAVVSGGKYLLGPDKGLNQTWDTEHYFSATAASVAQPISFSLPLERIDDGQGSFTYAHADGKSGDFDYTISATDRYGRTSTVTRRVRVDVEPPEIKLRAAPANKPENSWFDSTVNIRGEGSDSLSGINAVYYWFGKGTLSGSNYVPPTPPRYDTLKNIEDMVDAPKYWESASGYTSWSVPLEISETSFAEGYYTLYVIAVDGAGNIGGKKTGTTPAYTALSYNFRVDKGSPRVTETKVDPTVNVVYVSDNKSPLRKGSFDLNAKLQDSHGISRLVVKQKQILSSGSAGTTVTILDKSYSAGPTSLEEPLGNLPWNAADSSGNFTSAATAVDGIYEYEFTVYDLTISDSEAANRKTGTAKRVITVDKTKPKVHITDPGDGYQTLSSQMVIRGTSTDPFPGTDREIWYWTGAGTGIVPGDVSGIDDFTEANRTIGKWQKADGGIPAGWNKTIALGNDEGYRRVAVRAVDRHENVSDIEYFVASTNEDHVSVRYFSKDNAPPTLDENIIDTRGKVSRSPKFTMGGKVSDTNGVAKIELKQTRTDGTPSTVTVTLNLNTNSSDKNKTQYWLFKDLPYTDAAGTQTAISSGTGLAAAAPITYAPTTPYTGSGVFDYVITLYDVSGRAATEERHVTIDTQPPTVTLSAPPANPAPDSWLAATTIIKGVAADSGGNNSGIDMVYYWLGDPASPPAASTYADKKTIQGSGTPWTAVSAGTGGAFEITLKISDAAFAESKYRLLVLALDLAGNIGGTTNDPATTAPVSYSFGADKANPVVDELSSPSPSAEIQKTALFNLGGTLYDSYGIASYENVRITQTVGNGSPVVIKAYDSNSTNSVANYAESASHGSIPGGRPAGTRWWELTNLPRDPASVGNALSPLADGKYTYTISVKDNAGKETVITRVVYVDRTAPTAAITGPTELVNEKWYDGSSISVTGTASDAAPSSGIDAVYIWCGSGNAATPPALTLGTDGSISSASATAGWAKAGIIIDPANSGSATWNSAAYSLSGEGPRTVAVRVRDKAGCLSAAATVKTFWVDNTAPTLLGISAVASPRNSSFAFSGQGWDSNGLKSLRVTQKKTGVGGANAEVEVLNLTSFGVGSGTGSGLDASNTASWDMAAGYLPRQQTAAHPYALEDGQYSYAITLTDKSGRTTVETRTVLVDTTAALATGAASDIAITYPQVPVTDGVVNTWVSGTTLTIKGTAKDHDRSADPSPPAGTLAPSGIAKVIYYASHTIGADPAAPAGPAALGVWKAANYDSSTLEWNATFNLTDFSLAAGTNKLWVRVYDNAGNLSGAYARIFGVDQDDPAVAETTVQTLGLSAPSPALPPVSFTYARDSNFTLAGTVTETNIDKIVITQHVRNVDLTYVNAAPVTIATLTTATGGGITGSSATKDWTLDANTLPRKFAADGTTVDVTKPLTAADLNGIDKTFIYTITAYDLAGKVSKAVTRTVTIDKTGPEVAVTKPASLASFQNSVIEISGKATDGNEVKGVYYRVTVTPKDAAAAATLLDTIAPAAGGKRTYATSDTVTGSTVWSKADGTDTWSKYVDFSTYFGSSITEGALTLWVIATDLGNNYGANAGSPGDPVRVDFTLDQNPPSIGSLSYNSETNYQNITRLNKNIYANGDFSFSFDAWDTNALAASDPVTVKRGGTALAASASDGVTVTSQAHPTLTDVTAAKNRRVVVRQKAGGSGLADGTYTYTIAVTDLAKKTTEKTISVVVDTKKPDLSIGSVVPVVSETSGGTEKSNVNGLFWFNVNAMDGDSNIFPYQASPSTPDAETGTNGSTFGGVKYYLVASPGTGHPLASPFADTGGVVLTQSAYRGAVNSANLTEGTEYMLWVYARDGAGNVSSARYVNNLTVKQGTDNPVVNIPAMGAPSSADTADGIAGAMSLNPKNGGFPITGFVADDDNVDALADDTKLLFYISQKNPANLAAATWTLIPYSSAAAQGKVKKAQSTVNSDKNWNFTYTVPQATGDGNYLFKVAAADKDKAFPYTQNQAPAATLTTPAVAKVERVYRLSVDQESPSIAVTSIENTYKESKAITGTVKEANLKSFKVSLDGNKVYDAYDSNGAPKTAGELLLSGSGETKDWTLNIPAADFKALGDGPHSLLWSAEDAVGNPGSLAKTFYKDTSGPDINFTNINEDQMFIIKSQDSNLSAVWYNPKVGGGDETLQEPLLRASADVITDGSPRLTGTFSDEFSTVFASTAEADIKFWYRFDAPGASSSDVDPWKEATGAAYIPNFADLKSAPAKTVRWQIPLAGLGQGYHTVDIKVLDRWGTANGLTVKASANDPAGGKYYQYERVALRLDSDPPVITLPSAPGADKALVNGATFGTHSAGQLMFTLKADVKDVTLSGVSAKIYVGNSTTARHTFTLGTIVEGAEKTLAINSAFTETDMTALLAAAAAAGETSNVFKVEIVAVDGAPRQTIETLQFKMDGAPPTITTGNLVTSAGSSSYPTVIIDASPTIQGNISDDSGIGEAKYTIEKWNYGSSAWESVVSGQNLSATNFAGSFVTMEAFTINLGSAPLNLTDGKYRISFILKDKASPLPNQASKINGATDSINNIEFFIDRATPAMDTVQFKSPPFYSGTEVNEGSVDYMAIYLNASDLNTITKIRARLETDAAGTYPLTAAANSSVTGANYRLLIPKTAYAEGLHTLTLEAKDGAGRTTTITRDFTLDKTMPMLQIIEPVPAGSEPLAEITSEATIRGITVDNTSVSKLYYLFGRTEVANGTVATATFPANTTATIGGKVWREFNAGINKDGATIASSSYTAPTETSNLDKAQGGGSLYNWTIRLPNSVDLTAGVNSGNPNGTYVSLHSGSAYLCDLPIRFMMIDSAGNTAIHNYTVVVNPKGDEPTVTIASPNPMNTAAQNEVGGVITVVGAAKDNDWIHRVVFRVIDGDEPATGSPKTLPVYNALAGDGYALDAVTNASYAAAPYSDSRGGWHQAPIVGSPGSNVQWSINLNNNGGLNAPAAGSRVVTIQVLAYDTAAANHAVAQTMGEVTMVKVTFVDGLPFVVDDTVIITPDPKNGRPFKYDDPAANKRVGGKINIKARIRDDNGLKELAWHGEETAQYGSSILKMNPGALAEYAKPLNAVQSGSLNAAAYYMWLEGGTRTNIPFLGSNPPAGLTWAAPALNHNGTAYSDSTLAAKAYIDYEMSLTLDSAKLSNKAGFLANKAGTWTLSVLATDHTDFKMPANWTLQIDNYHPLGTYTGNGVAAGNNYQLQGLAWDTGAGVAVQGVKKVVAWFSRGPNFVPLNERDIGSGAAFKAASGAITVAHGRTDANKDNSPSSATGNWDTGAINDGTSPILFPDLTYTRKYLADGTTANPDFYKTNSGNAKFISGIEIDKNEPTADNDEDGFLEGMADAGNNFQWYARIDTTKFLDGLLTVHYLVYDHAGNASYYSNNIFISNNPPKVTSVDIGTDILGVGSADDPRGRRVVSANYGNTNITARNKRLSFKFSMQGDLGAKPFHYRFGYVSGRSSTSATALKVGQIYAITAVGTVNWESVGAPPGYGVGTTFMATDTTSFGSGSADLLTISNIQSANIDSANINDHVFSYTYSAGDFGSGSNQIPDATGNNAWFVLRVYNSLKIPMKPDSGAAANNGMSQTGAGGVGVYSNTGQFEVWDQPFDVVRIGLNVASDDTIKPEVKLWDLNPAGENAGVNGLNGLALTANGLAAQPPSSVDLTPNAAKSPNLLKGGLYNPRNNSRIIERSGHIEPRYAATTGAGSYFIDGNYGSATFAKDTLSGEVIIRGFAYDEQRLGAVYLRIDSPSANGTEFKILQADDSSTYNASNPGSRGLLVPVSGQPAFVYNRIGVDGHMAEWAYVWNTVKFPANFVAGDNVKIQVRVEDKRSAPNSSVIRLHPNTGETADGTGILSGTNDGRYPLVLRNADGWRLDKASNLGYNRIAVTLAPYLNSLRREASKGYSSLRSRQGWYTFSRGETIVAQGWNLKYPSGNTTVTFDTAAATVAATVSAQTPTGVTFTVPDTAVSGDVTLVANGVSTVNDRNDNRNPWNREDYNLSLSGNDLWIDDRAAHVWASNAGSGSDTIDGTDRMQINGSETPTAPAMTMAPKTGILWASWSNTANAAVYMNSNQGAPTRVELIRNSGGGGQLTTTDLYYSEPQRTYGTNATHPTVFYHSNRIYANVYSYWDAGGLKGYDPRGGARFDTAAAGENHQYNVELTYHNKLNTQFEGYHRVVYRNDDIHVSYYDSKDKSIKYWYAKSGWNISGGQYNSNNVVNSNGWNAPAQHWMNLDGGYDLEDTASPPAFYHRVRAGGSTTEGTWNFSRASMAGPWSAIDLQRSGNPVIAYFDGEHSTLRLAVATKSADPQVTNHNAGNKTTDGDFRVQYAMTSSDMNYDFAGEYVSMQIDQTNDDAHLAFFRSNSTQLIYLKLKWTGSKYEPYGPSVIVDEAGANGKWVDLALDKKNRPWISYHDISRAGNFDGVKMAYYDPDKYEKSGVSSYDMNGVEKTGWETMNVPAIYKVSENRTSIEVWPHRDTPASVTLTKSWAAAVGYTNPEYYRIAYYLKPRN